MTELDPKLTDEDAQKVLARALELQAQSPGALTVAQIREIASELSIPESAVDQALAEYQALRTGSTITARTPSHNRVPRVILLSLAWVGGAVVLLMILYMIARL